MSTSLDLALLLERSAEIRRLNAELSVARSQLAEAQRDTERLDWLDTQREPIVDYAPNGDLELIAYGWGVQEQKATVREAIDAAMSGERGEREEPHA